MVCGHSALKSSVVVAGCAYVVIECLDYVAYDRRESIETVIRLRFRDVRAALKAQQARFGSAHGVYLQQVSQHYVRRGASAKTLHDLSEAR
jgi:hypothetical protein